MSGSSVNCVDVEEFGDIFFTDTSSVVETLVLAPVGTVTPALTAAPAVWPTVVSRAESGVARVDVATDLEMAAGMVFRLVGAGLINVYVL